MKLYENEMIKMSRRKGSWIMLIILAGLIFSVALISRVAGNSSPDARTTANVFFEGAGYMTSVVSLLIVIVTSPIVAEEFSKGTIKFLLIRPYTRTQVLASKFFACLTYAIIANLVALVSAFIAGNIFLGFQSPLVESANIQHVSVLVSALMTVGTNLILDLLLISVTIFISAAFRSQSLAVGLGVALLFASNVFNILLMMAAEKHQWLKWNIFNILNIKSTVGVQVGDVSSGSLTDYSLTFTQSVIGILIYGVIFYALANYIFKKRDISLS